MRVLILSLVLPAFCAAVLQGESNALDDCQPQDRNGSALQETAVEGAIGLSCLYHDAGLCTYYTVVRCTFLARSTTGEFGTLFFGCLEWYLGAFGISVMPASDPRIRASYSKRQ